MTTGEVVGSVLLPTDKLLGVKQLPVGTGADLVDHSWFQIEENSTRNVLSSSGLTEESVEGIVTNTDRLVARHLAIRL